MGQPTVTVVSTADPQEGNADFAAGVAAATAVVAAETAQEAASTAEGAEAVAGAAEYTAAQAYASAQTALSAVAELETFVAELVEDIVMLHSENDDEDLGDEGEPEPAHTPSAQDPLEATAVEPVTEKDQGKPTRKRGGNLWWGDRK